MKSFLQLIGEVAKAVSPADKEFVALHRIAKTQKVAWPSAQFDGGTVKDHSKLSEPSDATGIKADIEKETPVTESWKQYLDEGKYPDKYDHIASLTSDDAPERLKELRNKDDQKKIKDFVKSKHWKEVDKKHTSNGEQMAGGHVDDDFHSAFKKWHKETHGTEHKSFALKDEKGVHKAEF